MTYWCSTGTFISSRQAVLRRPRRRPCQDWRCQRLSKSIRLTTQWNRGTYVHAHPTLVEQFSSQVSTPYRSRAGLFLSAPYQESELLRAASSFKQRRESRTFHRAVPSAVFLFIVFIVVGTSDLGPFLIGTLHYNNVIELPDVIFPCYITFHSGR